jgi:hypothetical protein
VQRLVLTGLGLSALYAARTTDRTRVSDKVGVHLGSLVMSEGRFSDGDLLKAGELFAGLHASRQWISPSTKAWGDSAFEVERPGEHAGLHRVLSTNRTPG